MNAMLRKRQLLEARIIGQIRTFGPVTVYQVSSALGISAYTVQGVINRADPPMYKRKEGRDTSWSMTKFPEADI